MVGGGLADPQVQVAAALGGDEVDGAFDQVDRPRYCPGVRWWGSTTTSSAQLALSSPAAVRAQAELGVTHGVGVARFPGHQAGKALPPTLDQVEPGMFAEGGMGIGLARRRQQFGDGGQVFVVEVCA